MSHAFPNFVYMTYLPSNCPKLLVCITILLLVPLITTKPSFYLNYSTPSKLEIELSEMVCLYYIRKYLYSGMRFLAR